MDIRKVKKLIELVQESGITELAITEGEESIRITCHPPMLVNPAIDQPIYQPEPQQTLVQHNATASTLIDTNTGYVQVSPLVGTFYAAANSNATPLVRIGQEVKQGEVICIIKAVKMINPIEAERYGVITKIWAKTGDAVEFNQPLFTIT